jgi:hypothetical protein
MQFTRCVTVLSSSTQLSVPSHVVPTVSLGVSPHLGLMPTFLLLSDLVHMLSTRGRVYRLQLLAGLASAVILGCELHGTHDCMLHSECNPESKVSQLERGPGVLSGTHDHMLHSECRGCPNPESEVSQLERGLGVGSSTHATRIYILIRCV